MLKRKQAKLRLLWTPRRQPAFEQPNDLNSYKMTHDKITESCTKTVNIFTTLAC